MHRHLSRFAVVAAGFMLATPIAAQQGAPGGPVPVELLRHRRAAFLASMPAGVAVIRSARIRSIEGDYPQDSDYRESNDFFYLTGIESPGGVLVMIQPDSGSARGEARLYLNPPPARPDPVSAPRTAAGPAAARLTGLEVVHARPPVPRPIRRGEAVIDPLDVVIDSIGGAHQLATIDYRRTIGPLRAVKDADEIRRLRIASGISAEAHRAAMQATRPGMWEYEIEAVLEYTFRRRGAERVGYPSIVGSGPNSTLLHYDLSRRQTVDGDIILIDAAAEFGYYTADVTRSFPINGRFTPRQRAIYALVLGSQQAAIDAIAPGITLAELNRISRDYMKEHSGTLCGDQSCDRYFIHGLGHMVGLDVHDINPYFTELRPGMTLTIEPGIYLPDEALGIRIEDVLLVTETGSENLSAGVPRTVDAIEALMASGRGP
ncbi:MAG TPA: aminopeptidase P N-terminal domain-containing protein [Gemmatimonadales bacterium]|nr:aminopeptidase P N-terminal domain-containing protein [Gemmatimonadales bacterium]